MSGRQAKLITPHTLRRMIAYARRTEQAERNVAIIFLSAKAGLRACEIARLEWPMLLTTDTGRLGDTLELRNAIAKKGGGRRIPLHPQLRSALRRLYFARRSDQYVVASSRGGPLRANSVVNFFVQMAIELGLDGCSSHSGRRTFVTMAARNIHRTGGSLRDVQLLAGHKSIETTQGYIQGNTQSQRRLVTLI
jgi:integrase